MYINCRTEFMFTLDIELRMGLQEAIYFFPRNHLFSFPPFFSHFQKDNNDKRQKKKKKEKKNWIEIWDGSSCSEIATWNTFCPSKPLVFVYVWLNHSTSRCQFKAIIWQAGKDVCRRILTTMILVNSVQQICWKTHYETVTG